MAAADSTLLYSTYKTFLMIGSGTDTISYSKLCDIKDYPDLGGSPDLIDMTTLSNRSKIGVPGIQNNDALSFTINYNPTVYTTLKGYCDGNKYHFAVYFGGTESGSTVTPTGDDGKITFDAMADIFISGKGVNEGREMTLTLTPTTDFAFSAPT